MFRITILAARRVLPPDLMTPANASYPFMKETGPEAVPPPASSSLEERSVERFEPVPEPYLKSIPSVFASSRIDCIVSCTELMKQADPCGCGSIPTLNQTGLLNDTFWWRSRCVSSASNTSASSADAKYPFSRPHRLIVPATRPMSWRTECSRSGLPIVPRKYFDTTMFVAICDQDFGTSTLVCSKTTSPRSFVICAERVSHSTSSKG